MFKPLSIILLLTLSLAGCSDEQKTTHAKMSDDNVFKGQIDSMNKAKGVESTIQGSFDQQKQHINAQ